MLFFFVVIHIKHVFTYLFLEILSKHFPISINTKTLAQFLTASSWSPCIPLPIWSDCLVCCNWCLVLFQGSILSSSIRPTSLMLEGTLFPLPGLLEEGFGCCFCLSLLLYSFYFCLSYLEQCICLETSWQALFCSILTPLGSKRPAISVNFAATPGRCGSFPGKPPQVCTASTRWLSLKNSGV